ncbi:MAG: SPOR domain-containing protein [Pseudomonadota bacterium]
MSSQPQGEAQPAVAPSPAPTAFDQPYARGVDRGAGAEQSYPGAQQPTGGDYYYPQAAASTGYQTEPPADPFAAQPAQPAGTDLPFAAAAPAAPSHDQANALGGPAYGDGPALRPSQYDQGWGLNSGDPRQQAAPQAESFSLNQYGGAGEAPFGTADYDPTAAVHARPGQQHGMPTDAYGGAIAAHEGGYDAGDDGYYDDEYEDELHQGSAWKRGVVVAASLVVAAAIGGGFAYGYRVYSGGPVAGAGGQLVRQDAGPAKVAPSKPGGRTFANTDSKLLGRLDEKRGVPKPANERRDGRVKPVAVLDVRPDGTIVPTTRTERSVPAQSAPKQSGGNFGGDSGITVPGMTIVGVNPTPVAPTAERAAPRAPQQPRVLTARPNPTQVPSGGAGVPRTLNSANVAPILNSPQGGAPQPTTALGGPVPSPASAGIPLPARNLSPRQELGSVARLEQAAQPTVTNTARAALPVTAPVTTNTAGGANGYVAVLASQGTRIEALTKFADLRQKYATVLSGTIPDVQKADLSSRGLGTMYRVVVGPPGSRAAANRTCSKLRTAGYTGCWVKAY